MALSRPDPLPLPIPAITADPPAALPGRRGISRARVTGFSLALSCAFRFAADTGRMGSATLRFGLLPDEGGQYLLVQQMGV